MATGYTAKLCDGSQTSFKDFAKDCMRAFGACVHMKDESFDKEYEPMKVPGYSKDALVHAHQRMRDLDETSDSSLIESERRGTEDSISKLLERLEKTILIKERLLKVQSEAIAWIPPTNEHNKFKEFMLEQLQTTLKFDGSTDHTERRLAELREHSFSELDPNKIRAERAQIIQSSIDYYTEQHEKDVRNINSKNSWVTELLKSLE